MESIEKHIPFWGELTGEQRDLLRSATQMRHFSKGAMIHSGSEDCIGLLLVAGGQLRVYSLSDTGRELTLYRLFERDMCLFSASCIIPGIQFDVMVAAEQDSRVLQIPSQVYRRLMDNSAAVANYTNALMASHFSEVMWLMDQIMNKKLDSRVAAFLLEEAQLSSSRELNITHEQIANHLGSLREAISRVLKYMQGEGLVELGRGTIRLANMKKLAVLANSIAL